MATQKKPTSDAKADAVAGDVKVVSTMEDAQEAGWIGVRPHDAEDATAPGDG